MRTSLNTVVHGRQMMQRQNPRCHGLGDQNYGRSDQGVGLLSPVLSLRVSAADDGLHPAEAALDAHAFGTCNFSLTLIRKRGIPLFRPEWLCSAPCVITQLPGDHVSTAGGPAETWDELFLMYDARLFPVV